MGETKLLSECSDNPFGDGVIEVVIVLPYRGAHRESPILGIRGDT
jgi:hypothetical protein